MTFQELEMIQHKLAEAPDDATLLKLKITKNEIMHFVIKQIWQAGYFLHNINTLEKTWAVENAAYSDTHSLQEIVATMYSQFKEHCIIKTSSMCNRGDKGGNNNTNHSTNMMSDQMIAQMAALEERNNHLKDN